MAHLPPNDGSERSTGRRAIRASVAGPAGRGARVVRAPGVVGAGRRHGDAGLSALRVRSYLGPRIEDREGLLREARYGARLPIAESRLRYDAERAAAER